MVLFDALYSKQFDDTKNIEIKNGKIILNNLKAGEYVLKSLNNEFSDKKILIVPKANNKIDFSLDVGLHLFDEFYFSLSPFSPLQIVNIEGSRGNGWTIKLDGVKNTTRVHVIGTHFIPKFNVFYYLSKMTSNGMLMGNFQKNINQIFKQQLINEEYQYILNRQNQTQFMSNSLSTPSFIIKPLRRAGIGKKSSGSKKAKTDSTHYFDDNYCRFVPKCNVIVNRNKLHSVFDTFHDQSSIEFLNNPSNVILNMKPDKNGQVFIDGKLINKSCTLLQIIALDDIERRYKQIFLDDEGKTDTDKDKVESEGLESEYRDIRMNLDSLELKSEQRDIIILENEINIKDFKLCEIQSYDTIKHVFNLLVTLSSSNNVSLQKWSFLVDWYNINQSTKLNLYH
eukprot:289724_1